MWTFFLINVILMFVSSSIECYHRITHEGRPLYKWTPGESVLDLVWHFVTIIVLIILIGKLN